MAAPSSPLDPGQKNLLNALNKADLRESSKILFSEFNKGLGEQQTRRVYRVFQEVLQGGEGEKLLQFLNENRGVKERALKEAQERHDWKMVSFLERK